MRPFTPDLDPSEVFTALPGRYTEVLPIAAGGQGMVFRAIRSVDRCLPNAAAVALKVLSADQLEERTDREVAVLCRVQDENLVRFVDRGRCAVRGLECVWLETEFVDGQSLRQLMSTPFSFEATAVVVHDIAKVISLLWEERVVHRDVKPENILIRPSGRAVLIDLGLARHLDLTTLTSDGKAWGTRGYYSPEQFAAIRSLTCKSDVYSLGIVAQEMVLGRHPTGRDQLRLLADRRQTMDLGRSDLPGAFCTLVDRMRRPEAHLRPSPGEVAERMLQIAALSRNGGC